MVKVNGKLQQPNPGRTNNGPEPSVKVGITRPGKNTTETVAKGKENTKWAVKEGTNYNHVTSYRNKDCNCHECFLLVNMCVCVLSSLILLSCHIIRIDFIS